MEDNEYLKHLSIVGQWSPNMNRKYVPSTTTNTKVVKTEEKPVAAPVVYSKEEEFIKASSKGDLQNLLKLTSSVCINTQNANNQTALICACLGGYIYAVKFLLARQARVDLFDKSGNSALHYACLTDNVDIVKVLLEKINPNLKNRSGQSILHLAVLKEKQNVLDFLLRLESVNINEQDEKGNTAVHLAILERNIKMLIKLLTVKNDLFLHNKDGYNPVNLSIYQDDFECLKTLINLTKDLTILSSKTLFQESNFQMAVRLKHSNIVEFLLNIPDDRIISAEKDEKYGYTCLHWAVLQLNKDLIEKILHKNSKLINIRDGNNFTVLEHIVNMKEKSLSIQKICIEITVLLLQYDADIDMVENRDGLKTIIKDIFKKDISIKAVVN